MNEARRSTTKSLFEALGKLYKQGQLLLMDNDRLMGKRGWMPMHNSAVAELSNSMNSPQRWFTRWAMRFYEPALNEEDNTTIDHLLFVSIHFASDADSSMQSVVDDPLICAGRLLYGHPMSPNEAEQVFDYWMCKYWFIGDDHDSLTGWRKTGQSRWYENLKGSESFVVPLYGITSSERLEELVIDPLLAVQETDSEGSTLESH